MQLHAKGAWSEPAASFVCGLECAGLGAEGTCLEEVPCPVRLSLLALQSVIS